MTTAKLDAGKALDYAALVGLLDELPHWLETRLAAIAKIQNNAIHDYLSAPAGAGIGLLTRANRECFLIATMPNWLPKRPGRRMPQADSVARFWHEHPGTFDVNLAAPACFRCGAGAGSWRHLERAHLVDRWCGGLDHEANLAMLCGNCHTRMPMFLVEQGAQAITWIQSDDDLERVVAIFRSGAA